MTRRTIIRGDQSCLSKVFGDYLKQLSGECIAKKGRFLIGVSGGSVVNLICGLLRNLAANQPQRDWTKWHILFCDERHLPADNADSTFGAYRAALSDLQQILQRFYPAKVDLSVEQSAVDYERRIRELFKESAESEVVGLDLLVLGMGPDGHTCSLFPGHPLLQVDDKLVAAISDSPKPPPERITFTLPLINQSQNVAFYCTGEAKADLLKEIIDEDKQSVPAALVQPVGELYWFLDEAAGAKVRGKMRQEEWTAEKTVPYAGCGS